MFPSLTPVCLTSIATGAFPDVHHIPHLVWYHRGEERVIEYGSSFPAMRAVGARRAIRDTIFGMSGEHLSPEATTVFEALEDEGLEPGAINFTCYRGRTRHPIRLPALARRNRWYEAVYGPRHFFYFNLFESERTGAPLAIRSRLEGSIDEYAAAVGRWLVTRDAFDFLVFYLPDYDYASHLAGPDAAPEALERSDRALGAPARGGRRRRGVPRPLRGHRLLRPRPDARRAPRAAAGLVPARATTRCSRSPPTVPGWSTGSRAAGRTRGRWPSGSTRSRQPTSSSSSRTALRWPDARAPSSASRSRGTSGASRATPRSSTPIGIRTGSSAPGMLSPAPSAGDVLVSAAEGWELADAGGRHHLGGGSHGSLVAGDTLRPARRRRPRRRRPPSRALDHGHRPARPRPLRGGAARLDAEGT